MRPGAQTTTWSERSSASSSNEAAGPAHRRQREGYTFPGSPSLQNVRADDGTLFGDFRRTLRPRYARAWVDLAMRWMFLAVGYAAMCAAASAWGARALWLVPLAAVWIGFWFASIVLFMHEAAHFNLHADKIINDRLANLAVCWMIGDDVADYRALHWQHHLHLGDVNDTEVSYRHAPTARFVFETLLGLHALRVFRNHQHASRMGNERRRGDRPVGGAVVRGLAVHALLLALTLAAGLWPAAVAWVLAVAIVFPFLSALREQLEHRSEGASRGVDYSRVPHGAVNRMFRRTLMARAFGSAGFRQHLLHHWDPNVSYTRFEDFETFLMRTDLAPLIDDARTTYAEAWRRLAQP